MRRFRATRRTLIKKARQYSHELPDGRRGPRPATQALLQYLRGYVAQGLTKTKIGLRLGRNRRTVAALIRRHGLAEERK